MAVYRIEIRTRPAPAATDAGHGLVASLRDAGLPGLTSAEASRLFYLDGDLRSDDAERIAAELLTDPVTELAAVYESNDELPAPAPGTVAFEVQPRPGVMDPVAESTRAELHAEGFAVDSVRTGRRYVLGGTLDERAVRETVGRVLANDCIEQVVPGTAGVQPAPRPPEYRFELRHVALRDLDAAALDRLSREAHLFLSRAEMLAIQAHFRERGRDPTDLELETLAQTWSEHCVHKTLRSAMVYRGAPLPGSAAAGTETRHYGNLLKDTIARATQELMASKRGPHCLSVFQDNAGVIAFDDDYGIAFKVETHNHPSAIEPYGGATTGIGGVIRDVIGCGLGAKPIASTDVFCVAPSDWPPAPLPKGVLHPWRVLRGVVRGVADYGNRMGIPTVNGAVYFDVRYLGNPLVFCGSVGLMPRALVDKAARPGDLVVVIGGRTGRDGIHGATFSSAELTDTHADEFSHAVQIGNAITEKRFLDALLQARDAAGGCLYTAVTDCGAGGLSSAVGEMAAEIGAVVELERVPLKYAGLRYDEIWISEAQERMVVAVPPANLDRFLALMRAEEVEATVIGVFGPGADAPPAAARIVLRFHGRVVGELDMRFLHAGVPRLERAAEWWPRSDAAALAAMVTSRGAAGALGERLLRELARPNVTSQEWIIRQYDHEVQGGSVVKPLPGPGRGPGDAAVLRPRLGSQRALVLGCGLAPQLADVDPYWMAAASIDEAVRNIVCVGGDPAATAILDNFCWGRSDDPAQLGALVRACQACYDVAAAFGTPFISGKDSLNNEFALDAADVEPLLATLRQRASGDDVDARWLRGILPALEERIRARRRLAIPATLLISALSVVADAAQCLTPDLKRPGNHILLVGGLPPIDFSFAQAARVHAAVAELIQRRLVVAAHDVSAGGWLVALAEMAIAAGRGAAVTAESMSATGPFDEQCAAYLVETADRQGVETTLARARVAWRAVGTVADTDALNCAGQAVQVTALAAAWSRGPA